MDGLLLIAAIACLSMTSGPADVGRAELNRALGPAATRVDLRIRPGLRESFKISPRNGRVTIEGGDAAGAMYGAFEFAERARRQGERAWHTRVAQRPFLPERGLNLFLTLPWNYAKNDTDYDPAALTDPKRWWFQNEDYWTTLLDLMARSRLNWLDIHGAWDISVTDAPNLYAYFIQSNRFPDVGVSPGIKGANLRQLNHVIALAHERGIRVSLMAYQADLRIPQNRNPSYKSDERTIYTYTEDVVERMIRQAPGLDAIGFRIGESGKSEAFFKCYLDAVHRGGRQIPLITRSWITHRQNVLPLARSSRDFTVEVKYNGEQWGAPYPVLGGRSANWYSYAYEDYLSDAGSDEKNAKTWPGWPCAGGGTWPGEPYKVVWQVRANGTHRILPFYNPGWVRRTVEAMKVGSVSGYTVEGEDCYFPKSPDYYLANPKDRCADWIHERDRMYWMTWGRLGYDPTTPDAVFDLEANNVLGPGAKELVQAWKRASRLVSLSFMAYSLGPDHRDAAPELEWGGDSQAFVHGQGFDTHVFEPIDEELANRATGGIDGRIPAWRMAAECAGDIQEVRRVGKAYQSAQIAWQRQVANAVVMASAISDYQFQRMRSAHGLAMSTAELGREAWNEDAVAISQARADWQVLAANRYFKPFTDRLRMHTNSFIWATELPKVEAEAHRVLQLQRASALPLGGQAQKRRIGGDLSWRVFGADIVCTLMARGADSAWLLIKPLPSSTFFHRVPMVRRGPAFQARFPRDRWGTAIAAIAANAFRSDRIPDALHEAPYLVVPAQPGPTPQIFNASEATAHLRPETIDAGKYGGLLLGTRASNFFHDFDREQKRKLLEPVSRGMRLVILQQNFGPYPLDWLPAPLRVESQSSDAFDPGGALDLPAVHAAGVLWQRFAPSDGWRIYGNGGIASIEYGKGEIWITTARLMQNMQYPAAARAFVHLLSLGGTQKPTILVDSCSEGGPFASSCHPDLMNSHGIPFLTLGEVIAREQGMDSERIIPGPVADDDVLGSKGSVMATAFLRNHVIQMAKRPAPTSIAAFEAERVRRKRELMRSLGLDPMPERTPLNARVTGTIQRNGYRIEKLVFESRPRFYVTAHVYVPDRPAHARLPAIMNVNGHWAHKKDEDRIQLRCAFQALHGYLAMAVDSPGFSFEGNSLIERRAEGQHNDFKLVEGGSNATGYYVWDTIRALDYLSLRPDVDMSRVGITGASGGGLATLYAFAADDRYKAAVPVVYMASMEEAPDNGCLCNHVPGTSLIGDRSDVIAIQAPKPVLIMGAQNDGEFPPGAMLLTHRKMADTWKLFGRSERVAVRIFPGGHDYSQGMREAMIGFFDQHILGVGDGSPQPEPPIATIDPEDHQLLAIDPPIEEESTMRDLSKAYLAGAPGTGDPKAFLFVNGGIPPSGDLKLQREGRHVTFESEPGLITPGILVVPKGRVRGLRIVASDAGKATESRSHAVSDDGFATLYVDVLGTGELADFELRYAVYAGRAPAFTGGWQIVRAAEAFRYLSANVEVVGRGPLSSQAAMVAGLIDRSLSKVTGYNCLRTWSDVFNDAVPDAAIQPRANLCPSLESLRSRVQHGEWHIRD